MSKLAEICLAKILSLLKKYYVEKVTDTTKMCKKEGKKSLFYFS